MPDTDSTPSDAHIVRQVLEGDTKAFETLLERHKDLVTRIAKRRVPYNDVEETAQDVFVRAYQSLATFRGKGEFRHWLASLAARTCYDYWRKAYRNREVPMSALTERHRDWLEAVLSDQAEASVLERGAQREAGEVLDWALGKLSAEDRAVLELVHLEGLSGREAAALLGWSIANVKVRAFRSRKRLGKILSETLKTRQEGNP